MSPRIIWGHVAGLDKHGRNVWPDDLKREVVQRIIRGERISQLARELGTAAALVQKWWGKLRPRERSRPAQPLGFAEVRLVEDAAGSNADGVEVACSRFTVNGITLEAERAIPLQDLTRLLAAMGSVR